jgi:hypothetical protein
MLALILSGCATQTGIVSTGANSYMLMKQGNGFWTSPSLLVADVTRQASEYCSASGKSISIVSTKEKPVGIRPGDYPEGEVRFNCN